MRRKIRRIFKRIETVTRERKPPLHHVSAFIFKFVYTVNHVGDSVPDVPQIRTNHNVYDYFILIHFKHNLTYIFAAIKYIVCRLCIGNRQNLIDCRLNQSLRNLGEHIFNQ